MLVTDNMDIESCVPSEAILNRARYLFRRYLSTRTSDIFDEISLDNNSGTASIKFAVTWNCSSGGSLMLP